MSWWSYYRNEAISIKHGYKTSNKRGNFGKLWYGKKWLTPLKVDADSSRFSRGKSYVRKGQVSDIRVLSGKITASVQGSRRKPYDVTITTKPLVTYQIDQFLSFLNEHSELASKLLEGEFDEKLAKVCEQIKLFPSNANDISYNCNCPDYGDPCKHSAAILCVFTEMMEDQPLYLFEFNGYLPENLQKDLQNIIIRRTNNHSINDYLKESFHTELNKFTKHSENNHSPSDITTVVQSFIDNSSKKDFQPDKENYWLGSTFKEAVKFSDSLSKRIDSKRYKNKDSSISEKKERLLDTDLIFQEIEYSQLSSKEITNELSQIFGVGEALATKLQTVGIECIYQFEELNHDSHLYYEILELSGMGETSATYLLKDGKQLIRDGNFICYHDNTNRKNNISKSVKKNNSKKGSQRTDQNSQSDWSSIFVEEIEGRPNKKHLKQKAQLLQLDAIDQITSELLLALGIKSINHLAVKVAKFYNNDFLPNVSLFEYHLQAIEKLSEDRTNIVPKPVPPPEFGDPDSFVTVPNNDKSGGTTSTESYLQILKDYQNLENNYFKNIQNIDIRYPFTSISSEFVGSEELIAMGYLHLVESSYLEHKLSLDQKHQMWEILNILSEKERNLLISQGILSLISFLELRKWDYVDLNSELGDSWQQLKDKGNILLRDFISHFFASELSRIHTGNFLSITAVPNIGEIRAKSLKLLGIHSAVDILSINDTNMHKLDDFSSTFIKTMKKNTSKKLINLLREGIS